MLLSTAGESHFADSRFTVQVSLHAEGPQSGLYHKAGAGDVLYTGSLELSQRNHWVLGHISRSHKDAFPYIVYFGLKVSTGWSAGFS